MSFPCLCVHRCAKLCTSVSRPPPRRHTTTQFSTHLHVWCHTSSVPVCCFVFHHVVSRGPSYTHSRYEIVFDDVQGSHRQCRGRQLRDDFADQAANDMTPASRVFDVSALWHGRFFVIKLFVFLILGCGCQRKLKFQTVGNDYI
jgi:hypothetical protein